MNGSLLCPLSQPFAKMARQKRSINARVLFSGFSLRQKRRVLTPTAAAALLGSSHSACVAMPKPEITISSSSRSSASASQSSNHGTLHIGNILADYRATICSKLLTLAAKNPMIIEDSLFRETWYRRSCHGDQTQTVIQSEIISRHGWRGPDH
jgi:hypothetical protein